MGNKELIDLCGDIFENVSPYDDTYPIKMFSNALKTKLQQAETAIENVYNTVLSEASVGAQIGQSLNKGVRYVVDAADSTVDAIENGKIKLVANKAGELFAQIRGEDGKFGTKLPIKREEFAQGIDPVQMANALQMKALQDQLQGITEQLNIIDQNVREVLQGQQNDRISLYYSGLALYLEALSVTDEEMKKALIAQSLRSLSDAVFQLTLTMKSDIQFLENQKNEKKKAKRSDSATIYEHITNIHRSFAYIHQAHLLKAGIYCEMAEMPAMLRVLDEYSYYIDNSILKNVDLLVLWDKNDDGTDLGIWKSRSTLRLDVTEISKRINETEKILYLDMN